MDSIKCFACSGVAEKIPRIKRSQCKWDTFIELACCHKCDDIILQEISAHEEADTIPDGVQWISPLPQTAVQWEALADPERYAKQSQDRIEEQARRSNEMMPEHIRRLIKERGKRHGGT